MSIFGSLGIVKAGFIVLWASVDSRWFPGPSLLRNAGFTPQGIGELLICADDGNQGLYVAEDMLRRILTKKRIRSVEVNLLPKDLVLWNILLVLATLSLSALGLLPYIFLTIRSPVPEGPFRTRWLYPTMRILGCDLVTIFIQFIFQFRILEEAYSRIRFMATDALLKDHGKELPSFWDPNKRSKGALKRLRRRCRQSNSESWRREPGSMGDSWMGKHIPALFQTMDPTILDDHTKKCIRGGLGALVSFSFPSNVPENGEQPTPALPTPPPAPNPSIAEQALVSYPPPSVPMVASTTHIAITAFFLCACQALLLLGLVMAVIGYVGCFSVVQTSPPESTGALVWLVCEAVLAILRTLVWAANPKWDDAKYPIALEKVRMTEGGADVPKKSSYGIGWMLDSATADDMHALIVGIDQFDSPNLTNLAECVADAKLVASYLKDTLLVPDDQIVALHDYEATRERIIAELQALSCKASVAQDAPIIVYFATHSFAKPGNKQTYLVPHSPRIPQQSILHDSSTDLADACISYDSIADILRHVAGEKTDNISLKEPNVLGGMTYKGLVDAINGKMESPEQKAICTCTSIYQNRYLFNGLFSRSVSDDGVRPVITVKYFDL
ncbi:hypothetical protein EST38_g461 [Candolleomyces aberdarensis]|uniref:Uncharacterized protein n=1 Tax=Candolleomyces aberdarensis TaxID=2316362 RepID=A0A4Q2DZF6_9AGAR|nr:hypothetical protein EST38_g461 [Candolleomyces aberdarensis]